MIGMIMLNYAGVRGNSCPSCCRCIICGFASTEASTTSLDVVSATVLIVIASNLISFHRTRAVAVAVATYGCHAYCCYSSSFVYACCLFCNC